MTDKTKPTELNDADLDVAGGMSPDMTIRKASTSAVIDADRTVGIRENGNPIRGLRQTGVRVPGVRKKG